MTNHPRRTEPGESASPPDRIAFHIARARRRRDLATVRLEDLEQRILREFLRDYAGDPRDAGAAALLLGQRLAELVSAAGAASGHIPPEALINLLRMIGERLWSGKTPASARCPYPLAGGLDCAYLCQAPDADTLITYMQAHCGLHHPEMPWPPVSDGLEAYCVDSGNPVRRDAGDRCRAHGDNEHPCTSALRPPLCTRPNGSLNGSGLCDECGRPLDAPTVAIEVGELPVDPETGHVRLRERAPAERHRYLLDHREEQITKGIPAEIMDDLIAQAAADMPLGAPDAEAEPDGNNDD